MSADRPPRGKRLRHLRMGLETVLGWRRQGFFQPYRYAEGVAAPGVYDALAEVVAESEPAIAAALDAIEALAPALARLAGPAPAPRLDQSWFPRLDAASAYALAATRPPATILEVGSGHSTRFLARALADARAEARQICIDPAPRAALDGLGVEWRRELLAPAHGALFAALRPGDMAVFDSSHLLAPGTDVDIILNRLLPVIGVGVRVHIHDVFLPDPYPASWAWRGYNEQNALGPLLTSGGWRILFASRYAATRMALAERWPATAALPMPAEALETSLWLERV